MNASIWRALVGSVVRWGLTIVGAGTAVSGDEISQLIGGIVAVLSLVWSMWQKVHGSRQLAG